MSEISESLIEDIIVKEDCVRIKFRLSLISRYKTIYEEFAKKNIDIPYICYLKFEQAIITIGGYDTEYGFQYTLFAIDNPNAGKRIYLNKKEFPRKLKDDEVVTELKFSFREKEKSGQQTKFRLRLVHNFLEIRPKPSDSIMKALISKLKSAIVPSALIFLSSAKEKVRSAKNDFLEGRYRSAMHNIYYAMHNSAQALYANKGKHKSIDHKNIGRDIEQILILAQQEKAVFQKLNLDVYSSSAEEAKEFRILADYGIGFEAGGSEKQLAQMLSKAEELVTISDYIINEWSTWNNNKLNLHLPREQEDSYFLDSLLGEYRSEDILIIRRMLVLTQGFHATTFAFRLLSESNLYYTDVPGVCFNGKEFAKFEDGKFTYRRRPGKGFIHLTKENVCRWSSKIKPHTLKVLATSKENKIQHHPLNFEGCFIELYILPDGRIYFLSEMDEINSKKQLEAFKNFEKLVKKLVESTYIDCSIFCLPIEIRQKKTS